MLIFQYSIILRKSISLKLIHSFRNLSFLYVSRFDHFKGYNLSYQIESHMILPCHKTTCRKGVGRWKRIICIISHTIFYRGKIFPVFTKMTLFFFIATLTTQFNNHLHKSLKFIMPRKLMMTQYWNRSIMIQIAPPFIIIVDASHVIWANIHGIKCVILVKTPGYPASAHLKEIEKHVLNWWFD